MSEMNLILLALWALCAVISLRFLQLGLILYLIGALLFPAFRIGEMVLRFELVYCLWLIFIVFMRNSIKKKHFLWCSVLSRYGLYLLAIIIATLLAIPEIREMDILAQTIQLYGLLRPFLVMFLFLNVPLDKRFLQSVLWVFVGGSIPLALLSIAQSLGMSVAEKITMLGYSSPWRTPIFRMLEEHHIIIRSTGVFETPASNATFFLLVLLTSGFLLLKGRHRPLQRWILYLVLGLAFIGGITTLSSTFLLGFVVCLGLSMFFLFLRYRHNFLRIAFGATCIIVLLTFFLLPQLAEKTIFTGTLRYQAKRILSGSVLETRYNPTSGILAGTYQAIEQRPILGWGLTKIENVFVGDSIYMTVLYQGGIIGLIIFLWVIWSVLKHTWRNLKSIDEFGEINRITFLFTLLLLAIGIGIPSFFILRLQEWYWALVGISFNRGLCLLFRKPINHHEKQILIEKD